MKKIDITFNVKVIGQPFQNINLNFIPFNNFEKKIAPFGWLSLCLRAIS